MSNSNNKEEKFNKTLNLKDIPEDVYRIVIQAQHEERMRSLKYIKQQYIIYDIIREWGKIKGFRS